MGRPTMVERPTITTWVPVVSTPLRTRSCCTPYGVAGLARHADVGGRRGVVAHEHGGEAGRDAPRAQRANVALELGAHRVAHGGAVDDPSGQNPPRGSRGSPRP